VRNLQFADEMADARAKAWKTETRRLNTLVKPGDVVYHGEALISVARTNRRDSVRVAAYRRDRIHVFPTRIATKGWQWKRPVLPARYCPESHARLFSMIRGVRRERLQDITEAAAKAEGISLRATPCDSKCDCGKAPRPGQAHPWFRLGGPYGGPKNADHAYRVEFAALWDDINGDGPWQTNPLVYVIDLGPSLTRVEADRLAGIRDVGERLETGKVAA